MATINCWEGRGFREVVVPSEPSEARALRAKLSERSRLRKTATKPAEFSGLNHRTST
jgi:hypothetical protein